MCKFNLLTKDLIRYKRDDGSVESASLPQVYAALMKDEVASFPALRPHQRHAWHAFLVQLGAIAMHRAGLVEPPDDADDWRRIIRALTPDYPDDEPWQLVVDDITKPAFMQPPASSEDKAADYKSSVATPDELDMLVTSKNHDLKASVASTGDIDDWLFALISLQTSEGFLGAGNYGISRMNGGLGCRPAFSLTPSSRTGVHAHRDIRALLNSRERLLDEHDPFLTEAGIDLLWLRQWDGARPEMITAGLDPFYIEICRRIRLMASADRNIFAVRATSKAARINSRALKGVTGDPWTPISSKDAKSLTLSQAGFRYRRTAEYLSTDWKQPVLFEPLDSENGAMTLVARGMVRGQGKTEGYHERTVELRPKTVGVMGRRGGQDELGEISRERIEDVRLLHRFLRHAISVFAAGGDTEGVSDDHRDRANVWVNRHDDMVDRDFFDDLQDEFEEEGAERRDRARNIWRRRLVDEARTILQQAEDTLPCPAIQRYRARVRADSIFEGRIRSNNGFPELYASEVNDDDNGDNN